jgi:ankyrin repeat protein
MVQKKKFERDIVAARAGSTIIEKHARSYLARRNLTGSRAASVSLQKIARKKIALKNYRDTQKKVVRISQLIRKFIYKTRYVKALKSATSIQARSRAREAHHSYLRTKAAVSNVQRNMRGIMLCRTMDANVQELHEAAMTGNSVQLINMLTEQPELRSVRNRTDSYKSLLHSAAQSGELKVVELLLTTFVDESNMDSRAVMVKDTEGNLPIHYACAGAHHGIIQYFSTYHNAQSKAGEAMRENLQRHGTALHRSLSKRMQIKSGSAYSKERRGSVKRRSEAGGRAGAASQRLSVLASVAAGSPAVPPAHGRASLAIADFFSDLSKPVTTGHQRKRSQEQDERDSASSLTMGSDKASIGSMGSASVPVMGAPRINSEQPDDDAIPRKEGVLKKRRENGWDGKRWVVIEDSQFIYYSGSKQPKPSDKPVTVLHLSSAVIKKSEKVKFAFEVHSAELINGKKNKFGRLYFAAASEMELFEWMNFIRNQTGVVSSKSYQLKRESPIIYFDEERRVNLLAEKNDDGETPLHALIQGASKDTQDHTDLYYRSQRELLSSSKAQVARPPMEEMNDVKARLEIMLWLVANGASIEEEDSKGFTPLLVAAKKGASTLGKVLVRLGATYDCETHTDGENFEVLAKDVMREGGQDDVADASNQVFNYSQMQAFVQRASRCTYVKLFISKSRLDTSKYAFENSALQISVYDGNANLVEKQQMTPTWPLISENQVFWGHVMHMNAPIENLAGQGAGTKIIIEVMVKEEGKAGLQSVVWAFIELSEKKLNTYTTDLSLYHSPVDKRAGSQEANLVDFDGNITCELMIINSSLLEVQSSN